MANNNVNGQHGKGENDSNDESKKQPAKDMGAQGNSHAQANQNNSRDHQADKNESSTQSDDMSQKSR